MKTAVIYARVSSLGDRQSTERQVRDLTDYADRNDFKIAKIFGEHISGAKRNEDRPVLTECLHYCEENEVSCLLAIATAKTHEGLPEQEHAAFTSFPTER